MAGSWGVGSVGCAAAAGAVGGAVTNLWKSKVQHTQAFSWNSLATDMVVGGVMGAAGGVIGKAVAPIVKPVAQAVSNSVRTATAKAGGAVVTSAAREAGEAVKTVARRATTSSGGAKAAGATDGAVNGGMAGVRATGATGEAMAGIVKNTTRIPSNSGKAAYRIPDELNSSVLGEVKNVKSLGWSSQISDFYNYATARGLEFRLYVRPDTVFRGQLAKLYEYGGFTRVDVPGMGP